MKLSTELYVNLLNLAYAVLVASIIIVLITTQVSKVGGDTSSATNQNSISALIGGYSGVLASILFIFIITMINTEMISLNMIINYVPLFFILVISSLMITYLTIYFDKLSQGEVADYYNTFSFLSVIFLILQITTVMSSLYKNNNLNNLSITMFNLLILLGIINISFVFIIGIILKFYSTQG